MKATALILLMTMACGQLMAQGQANDSLDIHRTINLDSVVVTGRVPQVRNKGAISKVIVANTMLSKMGDAMTMLANTPGLYEENGAIKVDGYGTPIYVLDGRVLKNSDELNALQADNIRSIEIDKMPSAEYGSSMQPVVKITTIKRAKDYLYMKVGQSARQTRRFMYWPSFNMRGQFGKILASVSYQGTFGGTMNKQTHFRDVYHDDGSVYHVLQQRNYPFYYDRHQLTFALDYNINPNNRIGVYYMYTNNRKKELPSGTNTKGYDADLSSTDINHRTVNHINLHNITAEYAWTKDKSSFRLTQDMVFNATKKDNLMRETGENYKSEYTSNEKTDYVSSSTNAKFNFLLPWNMKTTAGVGFDYVSSTDKALSDASFVLGGKYSNNVSMIERRPSAFITFNKTLGNFTLTPSVTYYYMNRRVNSRTGEGDSERATQHYSSIIPSITVKYGLNDDWNFALNYRTDLQQPSFSDINAGLTFADSLAYSVGNTNIRATRTNNLRLTTTWKDLSFIAEYAHEHAPIVSVMTQMNSGSNILTSQSINFSPVDNYVLGLAYSHTFKKISVSSSVYGYYKTGEYPFLGEKCKANKVTFTGRMNLNYKFNKFFYAYINYRYQSYWVYLTMKQKPINALSVGAVATLLNDRLNVNLTLRNILGLENLNNFKYSYGTVVNGVYGKNDLRGVTLSVYYTIFNKKVNVKTRNQNTEILNRM